jgi:hypothetical protein
MLDVTYSLTGTMSHELDFQSDHLRRVFDLIFSSQIIPRFTFLLQLNESVEISETKLSIVRAISLLTMGTPLIQDQNLRNRLSQALAD